MLMANDTRPPVTTTRCTLEIVTDAHRLDMLEDDWNALFVTSPTASPPLRFEWIRQWWRIYGPVYGNAGSGLRVISLRRDGRLIGVLPLYQSCNGFPLIGARQLRFISTGAAEFEETCADYLDLLHAPGESSACLDLLTWALTKSSQLSWDQLLLPDMSPASPLLDLANRLHDGRRRISQYSPGVCHIADLSGGLERYLADLSSTTRKKARKMLRDLQTPDFKFEIATTPSQINLFFDQLVDLHRKRWTADGKPGSFAPRHAQFHRELCTRLAPMGQVVIARLCYHDQPIALTYGHRVGAKFDSYQMGVDHKFEAVHSPGAALYLGLLSHLWQDGVVMCDQLVGANRFKTDYAKQQRPLMTLKISQPGFRLAAAAVADLTRRSAIKIGRLIAGESTDAITPPQAPQPNA